MTSTRRQQLEPGFLLHHRPWSDSSRILDLLTRQHGRITLFAHGVRRPKSPLRALLRPFAPLLLSWSGSGDGGTLTGAEPGRAIPALPPDRLLSGFYLNELLLRLLAKQDRHERLYDGYVRALAGLAGSGERRALREFELLLLEELGYGIDLGHEAAGGGPLSPDRYYHFEPGRGLTAVREPGADADAYRGRDLLAVARRELDGTGTLTVARRVLGAAISHCLEGRGLASREVMLALKRRERDE